MRTLFLTGGAVGLVASLGGALATTPGFNRDKVRDMLQPDWLGQSEPFPRPAGP